MRVVTRLDEYNELGMDFVIWRNDYPYPKGTKITLNDVSIQYINNILNRCYEYGTDGNEEYILILKHAILRKRLEKIEKIKDRIQCQKK